MRLVLLGPPGAGKGTQAVLLAAALGVPHVSTGDLFRANIVQSTPLGMKAKSYLDAGELVPSALTVAMVRDRLGESDAVNGFLLDGFPRSVEQAGALGDVLAGEGASLDGVLSFEVDEDVVVARMLERGREDDTQDVIRNRLRVYRDETSPLLEYYADTIVRIDATGDVDKVNRVVLEAVDRIRSA